MKSTISWLPIMNTGMFSQYSAVLLSIYRQAQECPVDQFQDTVLGLLKAYLPFDSSMWGTATMTPGGIDIHSIHLFNSSQAMLDDYEKIKHQDSAAVQVTQQRTMTKGFHVDDFAGDDNREIRQFLHHYGHRNILITSDMNPISRFVQWVSLFRIDAEARCSAADIDLLTCLAPHLMQALAINRLVHLDRLNKDAVRAKWCVAIVDTRGVIYHADERFRELVFKAWRGGDAGCLPPALMARLLQQPAPPSGQVISEGVIVQCSPDQGLLFLKARQCEAVDTLSEREFLVARLIASGLTQKQVATQLERSPETIRTQIRAIFNKLSINNVAMLGALLALRES
jgi:DNA-binding CsgD family transcriptional regulator